MYSLSSRLALLFACIFVLKTSFLFAKEADTVKHWNNNWVIGINGSQATYNNWSQGGVNSISGSVSSVYKANYQKERFTYNFENNLKYGQVNNEGQGVRKTDDQILIRNAFELKMTDISSIVANINFQSQFAPGFTFDENGRTKISDAFAPAYLNENIGYALTPNKKFKAELGAGFKQTIVTIDRLATSYGVDEGENFRFEAGFNIGLHFSDEVMENVTLTSSFESFSNVLVPLSSTDFIFRNELVGSINKYLNMNLQFTVMYDDDFSNELQIKQVLAAGFTFNIL